MREQTWEDVEEWDNPIEPALWNEFYGPIKRMALFLLVASAAQAIATLALVWKSIS